MNKCLQKIIVECLNENEDKVVYKKRTDEDRTTITAYIGGEEVGSIGMEILFDSYSYEFEDIFDEDEFNELYTDRIVKIEDVRVNDNNKGMGIGSELMKRGMRLMQSQGYKEYFLNASPMGYSGLDLSDLVDFYKKFGFKELSHQGNNVNMGITK